MRELVELTRNDKKEIQSLFLKVFTTPPWNDDWSDSLQLNQYLQDLTEGWDSLNYGYYEDGKMIGFALGHIRHWWEGTEYVMDEFCIDPDVQGKGIGEEFLKEMEEDLRAIQIRYIILHTERDVPAYDFYQKCGFQESKTNVMFVKKIEEKDGE